MENAQIIISRLNSIRGSVRCAAMLLQAMPNNGSMYDEFTDIAAQLYRIDDLIISKVKKLHTTKKE